MKHTVLRKQLNDYFCLNDETIDALLKKYKPYKLAIAVTMTKKHFQDDNNPSLPYKEPREKEPTLKEKRDYFAWYYKGMQQ